MGNGKKIANFFFCLVISLSILSFSSHAFGEILSDTNINSNFFPQESALSATLRDSIRVDDFYANASVLAFVNFIIESKENFRVFLLLPASVQPWSQELSVSFGSDNYFYNFESRVFKGSCYSEGTFFPFDTYELWFIFCFDIDLELVLEKPEYSAYFGNSMYYDEWKIERYSLEKLREKNNSTWIEHVAPGKEQLEDLEDDYDLKSFYGLKIRIMRTGTNLRRSFILWFPPGIIFFLIVGYTFWLKDPEKKIFRNSIRLFTGISFFLAGYLIAIQNVISPVLTLIEIVILYEITGSMIILLFEMLSPRDRYYFLTGLLFISAGSILLAIFGDFYLSLFLIIPGIPFLAYPIYKRAREKQPLRSIYKFLKKKPSN